MGEPIDVATGAMREHTGDELVVVHGSVRQVHQRFVNVRQTEHQHPGSALDLLLLRLVGVAELVTLLVMTPRVTQVVQCG
ncbi:hypothetical protein ABT203_01850 [Streptomyces sp900105245]|uniref:hypothetical protein n=1 Tax=Streptomyces sp. 900105245 TaxID=3154379 RepID=UPI00333294AA